MKTTCPSCGATTSLDALLGHSEASRAFASALNLLGDLAKPLIKYLALFRSANRNLTFERASKLLDDLAPSITAKQIKRNHQVYPAPISAWVWAIGVMLERRDQNKIDLPLKSHGYLYEVISSYKPENAPGINSPLSQRSCAAVPLRGDLALVNEKSPLERAEERKQHERQKHEKPAMSMADFVAHANKQKQEVKSLNNVPPNHLFAYLAQNRRDGESTDDTYRRLKALETEQSNEGETP